MTSDRNGTGLARRLARLGRAPEWIGAALVVALVVVVIGGLALLGGGGGNRFTGAAGLTSYDGIGFRADGLTITVPGGVFGLDPATAQVHSDPGSPEYRTLEFTWQQRGIEMRLNLYFASDGASWWVSEARTYDGRARGEWIPYQPEIRRAMGSAFDGPVTVTGSGPTGTGRLRIDRLVLLPTFRAPVVAATTGPVSSDGGGGPVQVLVDAPFAPGQVLNCIGAESMTPQQLALYARSRGYAVEFRYEKDDQSYAQEPPAGSVLTRALWGSSGQLLVFASPPDDPYVDQLRLTAERACPPAGAPAK